MSTAEIIITACGETTQDFHLNVTTYPPTGVSILLLFESKRIAKPNSNNASAHPEPLPIRQSTGSSLLSTPGTALSSIQADQQSFGLYNTKFEAVSKAS